MSFNPDPSKQAQEVIFSRKTKKNTILLSLLRTIMYRKLKLILFSIIVLSFLDHLKMILNKVNKTIGLLRKLQNIPPKSALLTIYKSFIRLHLDYGGIISDQAYNASFPQKLELLHYVCLSITEAIRGTSRENQYEELGLESLQLRRWFRKLSCFYKLLNSEHPRYLFKLTLQEALVMLLEIYIVFLSLKQDILFLKTISSRKLLLNGINLIIT